MVQPEREREREREVTAAACFLAATGGGKLSCASRARERESIDQALRPPPPLLLPSSRSKATTDDGGKWREKRDFDIDAMTARSLSLCKSLCRISFSVSLLRVPFGVEHKVVVVTVLMCSSHIVVVLLFP